MKQTHLKLSNWLVLGLTLFLILSNGCKEVPPFINYEPEILLANDTTYLLTSAPVAEDKNLLIEDISGVRCINCPAAAEMAHMIKTNNPEGRVVVLTLHTNKYGIYTRPITDTFNTIEATLILDNLIGLPLGLPAGALDRKIFDGKTDAVLAPPSLWESYANQQLALKTKANLEFELIVNKESRSVIANIKATFLEDFADGAYLSVFLSESFINSDQLTPDGYDEEFEHNFILRKGITPYNGILLASEIEANRVFEKGFEFEVPDNLKFDNCNVVVLINKFKVGENDVIQSMEKSLRP
jgi:Outer membrane protein Omp28